MTTNEGCVYVFYLAKINHLISLSSHFDRRAWNGILGGMVGYSHLMDLIHGQGVNGGKVEFFFGDNEGGDCVVSSMMIYNVGVGGGGV